MVNNKSRLHKALARLTVLCLVLASMGLASCNREEKPRKGISGLIRKAESKLTELQGPGGKEQPSNQELEEQLRRMPGRSVTVPPPSTANPEVQRVLKTVDEVNRINEMNRRNQ